MSKRISHWVRLRKVFIGVVILGAWANPVFMEAAPKWTPDLIRNTSQSLFEPLRIISLKITIAPEQMGKLSKSYNDVREYVPAEVRQGTEVYSQTGLRLRGVSTFQPINQKPNFTLKFNEFADSQKFHGLRKVRLSNAMFDPSYLREWLGGELFTAAGVAAPRVNFARVELNGRDLGLYVLAEGITKDFLKLHWGADKGAVYEGDEADIDQPLELDYGKPGNQEADLRSLVEAANETDATRRYAKLQQALELKTFASYVATEVMMNVWDGYSMRLNNYRIFYNQVTSRTYFIPHGLDRLFEDPDDSLTAEMKGIVTKAMLETPEALRLYARRLSELTTQVLVEENLIRQLDKAAAVLLPELKELQLDEQQAQALSELKNLIHRRIAVLHRELPPLSKAADAAVKTIKTDQTHDYEVSK